MGRIGEPEDIANAVVFLAVPEAGWVTAQMLLVASGWTHARITRINCRRDKFALAGLFSATPGGPSRTRRGSRSISSTAATERRFSLNLGSNSRRSSRPRQFLPAPTR